MMRRMPGRFPGRDASIPHRIGRAIDGARGPKADHAMFHACNHFRLKPLTLEFLP
jgi:hypothetical protein